MNVVDSSCWLEFFADGPNAPFVRQAIEGTGRLLVPTIVLFEVFRRVLQQRDEQAALRAAGYMARGRVIELDATIALAAARLGHELKLPLADSIILATSRLHKAVLWTQDAHFRGLAGVKYAQPGPPGGA